MKNEPNTLWRFLTTKNLELLQHFLMRRSKLVNATQMTKTFIYFQDSSVPKLVNITSNNYYRIIIGHNNIV